MQLHSAAAKSVAAHNDAPTQKAPAQNTAGISFLGSVSEAVRQGKITMPGGADMSRADLLKNKFEFDLGVSQEESEEELIKGFLARIKRILDEKKK